MTFTTTRKTTGFSARRGLVLLATAALWLVTTPALSQGAATDDYSAFREKLAAERAAQQPQAASTATPAVPTIPVPSDPLTGQPAASATSDATLPVIPADVTAPPLASPSDSAAPQSATSSVTTTTVTTTTPSAATSPVISPDVTSPVASPIGASADVVSPLGAAANPLGPAANLPLNGQLQKGPQTQAEIQAALEAETAVLQKKADEQVFSDALKQLMPLKPEQVRKLLGTFQDNREAAETPYSTPEPKQIVTTISLDPSDAPQVIKLSPGNVTTITILDSTGSPWPIQDVSWAGKFAVTPPESGGHVMRVTPQTAHGVGNISIRLVDLIAPITMTLQTGLDEVYYRFDARIPKPGPLAKTPLIEYGGLKSVAGKDNAISSLLDGTPPSGARRLKVDGPDGRTTAYKINDKIYLRTPLTLLSPGWDSSATSADGINVYTIPKAPVLILSDQGRMVQTRLADEEVRP